MTSWFSIRSLSQLFSLTNSLHSLSLSCPFRVSFAPPLLLLRECLRAIQTVGVWVAVYGGIHPLKNTHLGRRRLSLKPTGLVSNKESPWYRAWLRCAAYQPRSNVLTMEPVAGHVCSPNVWVVETMVDGSADGLRFPLFAASLSSKSGPRTRSGLFTRKFGKSWFRWSARRISFDDCMHSGNWMIAFH